MAEKLYLCINIIPLLIIASVTMITGKTYGEAINVHIHPFGIFLLLLLYLLAYGIVWQIYQKTKTRLPGIKGFPKFEINRDRIHTFYFICLLISLIGLWLFNIGKLGAEISTEYSFIFNLIKFSEFFPIYYVIARDTKKRLYWINILLYCYIRFSQGWTGFVMTIAVYEIYFRMNKKGWIRMIMRKFRANIMAIGAIICGGYLYYFLYPLKYSIRYGVNIRLFRVTLWEGFMALVERLTNFPVYTSAWQNINEIVIHYREMGISFAEFRTIFFPLLPSFLMQKNIRPMSNLVKKVMFSTLKADTGTAYGFWMYWYTLLRCDIADFIVCLVMYILGFLLTCSILKAFNNEQNDIRILYFIFLVMIANGSSVESMIGYGYIASLYLIVIMILFGVVKVKVKIPQGKRV